MELLAARGLRFSPRPGLSYELDLVLTKGRALLVEGPSGCGKSTLLRVLVRLTPAEGELALEGSPASAIPPTTWRRRVAYLPQRAVMLPGSVADNLAAGFAARGCRDRFDEQRAEQLMQRLGLDLQRVAGQPAGSLSGGEAARVAIVRALLLDPSVVLADEPLAGLDAGAARATGELFVERLEQGGALVLVSHRQLDGDIYGARLHRLALPEHAVSDRER